MATNIRKVRAATVLLWNREVGAVAWDDQRGMARFEYDSSFIAQGLNIAPLTMPLRGGIHEFPVEARLDLLPEFNKQFFVIRFAE